MDNEDNDSYYVFAGTAYTKVIKGDNPTTIVTSDLEDRHSFYNDPALRLSDADLKQFKKTEGYPLCIEHDPEKRVGDVYHTWVGKGDSRALKMFGRVKIKDENGKEIAAGIDAANKIHNGTYSGLSVGYGASLSSTDEADFDVEVVSKSFREISLVHEPFFPDCKLAPSFSITASKQTIKKPEDIKKRPFAFFIPIVAGKMDQQQQPQQTGGQQQQQDSGAGVTPNELLKEAYKLKEENEKMAAKVKQDNAEREQEKKELEALRAYRVQRDAEYEAEQMPKANAFIESVVASGVEMTEGQKKSYIETFCNREYAEHARLLENQHKKKLEFAASAAEKQKKVEEELAAARKELEDARAKAGALSVEINQTKRVLTNTRGDFANALGTTEAAEDEKRMQADFAASSARPGQILCRPPVKEELEYLKVMICLFLHSALFVLICSVLFVLILCVV